MQTYSKSNVKMLKYLSYINIFLAITFLVIAKNNEHYLEMTLAICSLLFNWLTLFHFIKNNMPYQKWHINFGIIGILYALLSTLTNIQASLDREFFRDTIVLITSTKQLLAISIIIQFILAYKANKLLKADTNSRRIV
jgi:hypothetical protein